MTQCTFHRHCTLASFFPCLLFFPVCPQTDTAQLYNTQSDLCMRLCSNMFAEKQVSSRHHTWLRTLVLISYMFFSTIHCVLELTQLFVGHFVKVYKQFDRLAINHLDEHCITPDSNVAASVWLRSRLCSCCSCFLFVPSSSLLFDLLHFLLSFRIRHLLRTLFSEIITSSTSSSLSYRTRHLQQMAPRLFFFLKKNFLSHSCPCSSSCIGRSCFCRCFCS